MADDWLREARERMWREFPEHMKMFPRDFQGIWGPTRFACSICGRWAWMPKAILHHPNCRVLQIKALMGTDEWIANSAVEKHRRFVTTWRFRCRTCQGTTDTWGTVRLVNRSTECLVWRFTDEKYYCGECGSLHTKMGEIEGTDRPMFYVDQIEGRT